jgi:RNA polymerase sigma-70 factor (ECF subfamily)
VQAARGGDREALDTLLRRHYDRLYALCRRMTGDAADAADACQEALIAIVRGLPAFDGRSAFGTWAYRVATNACLDELRRRRRRPEPGLPEGSAEVPSPIDSVESSTTRVDLDRALQSLPADYRAAVVLRDVCGLSYEEIGEALLIPPGTVRSRIARGRAALVPLLAPGRNPGPSAERPSTG